MNKFNIVLKTLIDCNLKQNAINLEIICTIKQKLQLDNVLITDLIIEFNTKIIVTRINHKNVIITCSTRKIRCDFLINMLFCILTLTLDFLKNSAIF